MRLIPVAVIAVAVVASHGAQFAVADEPPSLTETVERYAQLRTALAADDIESARRHAGSLVDATDRKLAAAASELSEATEVVDVRKAFGALSKALIAQVEANETNKKDSVELPRLHVFECSMAKPYGKWLQLEIEIANPYMGSAMPRCGSRTDLLGGGGEPKRLLEDYLPIREALAGDSIDGVRVHAETLAFSDDRTLAAAAKELAAARNVVDARKAFGDVSKALIALVEANEKRKKGKVELPTLHLFECSMASPYGRWLQDDRAISNPYMGSRMPRCGKLVRTIE